MVYLSFHTPVLPVKLHLVLPYQPMKPITRPRLPWIPHSCLTFWFRTSSVPLSSHTYLGALLANLFPPHKGPADYVLCTDAMQTCHLLIAPPPPLPVNDYTTNSCCCFPAVPFSCTFRLVAFSLVSAYDQTGPGLCGAGTVAYASPAFPSL